jgi:hypothetical protein
MFERESEMAEPVRRWMSGAGLAVRAEFVTPWGICDLVGLQLRREYALRRIALRQTRPVGSLRRAALLLAIPDAESEKAISLAKLARVCGSGTVDEISGDVTRLLADRFIVQSRNGFQRIWSPIYDRLVAIELKLDRVEEALRQARKNLLFVEESFVALPAITANRVLKNAQRSRAFFDCGIGLLSVGPTSCNVLIESKNSNRSIDEAVRLYSGEKFWTPAIQRQLIIKGSATHSGRRAGPSFSRSGNAFPKAYAADRS